MSKSVNVLILVDILSSVCISVSVGILVSVFIVVSLSIVKLDWLIMSICKVVVSLDPIYHLWCLFRRGPFSWSRGRSSVVLYKWIEWKWSGLWRVVVTLLPLVYRKSDLAFELIATWYAVAYVLLHICIIKLNTK